MINISAEDTKLFEQNGFTKEKVGATVQHYREQGLSDEDIQARMDARINEFRSNTSPNLSSTGEGVNRGVDLTPSGLIEKGANAAASALLTPVEMIRSREINPVNAYKNVYNQNIENMQRAREQSPILSGAADFAQDMAGYTALPILRGSGFGNFIGNAAIQGGIPGALEGLKEGENPLKSAGTGTGIAAGIQSVPYVGRLLSRPASYIGKKLVQGLTDLKPATLEQLVKPNSQALDLTEDTAQNLLMNTTERVQRDYKNLLDNAGLEVQKAALNLPEERGVFASSLKNSLDDIYNGYSTSGIQEINPAFNNAGDIYDNINGLIEAGTTGEKVSAKNLNDIMGNIKNYPLDWSKTSTKDRQTILKQIYGDFQRRLGNLSPELRKANYNYSKLAKFDDNEGVRRIINPNVIKGENIDSASQALRNYNSTVTKGNTNRNIQDLENILVQNGKEPFINDINDVNAAMDLLTSVQNGRNFLGATTLAKGLVSPALKGIRALNRAGVPENVTRLQELLREPARHLLNPLAVRMASPMLYGGISNTEDY